MVNREEGLAEQGKRLAAWRASQRGSGGKRMSQEAAARRISASQGAWAAWEKGKKAPDAYFAGEIERLTRGKMVVRAKDWVFRRASPESLRRQLSHCNAVPALSHGPGEPHACETGAARP